MLHLYDINIIGGIMAQNLPNNESQKENIIPEASFGDISKVAKVQVTLCAELGRAKLPLKDVIEYDTGSVITLDKTTSSSVDIFVDDILIAKGKIVAIEDSYGIKIVEIIENKSIENNT